jgi:hypothetical protein
MVEYPLILIGILAAFVLFGVVTAYVSRIAARRTDLHPAE